MTRKQLLNDIGNNYICYDTLDSYEKNYFKITVLDKNKYSYGEKHKTVTLTDNFEECIDKMADWYITRYLEIIDSSAYYDEFEKHIRLWLNNELDIPIKLWIYNGK